MLIEELDDARVEERLVGRGPRRAEVGENAILPGFQPGYECPKGPSHLQAAAGGFEQHVPCGVVLLDGREGADLVEACLRLGGGGRAFRWRASVFGVDGEEFARAEGLIVGVGKKGDSLRQRAGVYEVKRSRIG